MPSSQIFDHCGYNRETQNRFECQTGVYTVNANINDTRNILTVRRLRRAYLWRKSTLKPSV